MRLRRTLVPTLLARPRDSARDRLGRSLLPAPAGAAAGPFAHRPVLRAHAMVVGPGRNFWFAGSATDYGPAFGIAGSVGPWGPLTEPAAKALEGGGSLDGIAYGADGNLWITAGEGEKILVMTPAGSVADFPVGVAGSASAALKGPDGIVAGPGRGALVHRPRRRRDRPHHHGRPDQRLSAGRGLDHARSPSVRKARSGSPRRERGDRPDHHGRPPRPIRCRTKAPNRPASPSARTETSGSPRPDRPRSAGSPRADEIAEFKAEKAGADRRRAATATSGSAR